MCPQQPQPDCTAELPAPGELVIKSERRGTAHVIVVAGELDLATAATLAAELEAAQASDAREIVLDLGGVHFIDSRGLGVILQADAVSRADGHRLGFRRGPPEVQRLFEIAGVADRLPFID